MTGCCVLLCDGAVVRSHRGRRYGSLALLIGHSQSVERQCQLQSNYHCVTSRWRRWHVFDDDDDTCHWVVSVVSETSVTCCQSVRHLSRQWHRVDVTRQHTVVSDVTVRSISDMNSAQSCSSCSWWWCNVSIFRALYVVLIINSAFTTISVIGQ